MPYGVRKPVRFRSAAVAQPVPVAATEPATQEEPVIERVTNERAKQDPAPKIYRRRKRGHSED